MDDMVVAGQVEAGVVLIDSVGKSTDEVTEPVIRDRQMLSEEGVVVIVAVASKKPSVEVILRGMAGDRKLAQEIKKIALDNVRKGVRDKRRLNDIRDDVFYPVRRYLRKATGRNPLIVPTILAD